MARDTSSDKSHFYDLSGSIVHRSHNLTGGDDYPSQHIFELTSDNVLRLCRNPTKLTYRHLGVVYLREDELKKRQQISATRRRNLNAQKYKETLLACTIVVLVSIPILYAALWFTSVALGVDAAPLSSSPSNDILSHDFRSIRGNHMQELEVLGREYVNDMQEYNAKFKTDVEVLKTSVDLLSSTVPASYAATLADRSDDVKMEVIVNDILTKIKKVDERMSEFEGVTRSVEGKISENCWTFE